METESPYLTLDKRFKNCQRGEHRLQTIAGGGRWFEGPAYFAGGRYLVWSDIPNNRLLCYSEATEATGVFRHDAHYPNGNTVDREGRLLTCEHGSRSVTRTEHDGSVTVLAERYEGKRLNSPNDVVVRSDGTIWFTDPAYGIDHDYEGFTNPSEIESCNVYRLDPSVGALELVADDLIRPNGLAFSIDESRLYISDTGASHLEDGPQHLRVFQVEGGRRLSGGDVFATSTAGFFDGLRLDSAGRIWTSAGDGVHCYDPDGTLLGKILVPEAVANLCFGGSRRNIMYICATTTLYALMVSVTGAAAP